MRPDPVTRRPRRRASGHRLLVFVAVVGTLLAGLATPPAGAQSVEGKRAEAQQVAAQLDGLERELSALDEQYNTARLELAAVEEDIAAAQQRVDGAAADMDATRDDLRRFAVEAYVTTGDADTLDALMGDGVGDLGARQAYAEVATGSRRDLVDQLSATRARSDAEIGQLEAVRAEAAALEDQLSGARSAADAKVREQEALQARVEGELATLVQQEQARRAAEEQARAEAAAREASARQEAARLAAAQERSSSTTAASSSSSSAAAPSSSGASPTTTAPAPSTPTTTAPPTAPPVPGGVGAVLAAASSQVGTPYVWAGASPEQGFDCSGFTMWAWSHGGRSLPHSAAAQMSMTRRISIDQLQPGDLVFYGSPVHHVALYVGNGTIVHAPGRGRFVRYDSVHYWSALAGAGRL